MTRTAGSGVAWDAVRNRLKDIEASLANSFAPNQTVVDEVYRRRAKQLANRQAARADAETLPVLIFRLGEERFAIELSALAEVFPFRACTAIPGTPAVLLGVINVRGELRAVGDLRRILELPPGQDQGAGYVLMLRQPGRPVGLRVDWLDEVRRIDPAQLLPAVEGASRATGLRVIKALTADTVLLIDASAALAHLGLAIT